MIVTSLPLDFLYIISSNLNCISGLTEELLVIILMYLGLFSYLQLRIEIS